MNILYIVGNGLDIAHHMETSYQSFFKYYLAVPSNDIDILAMKKDIDSHRYETWADLEKGMGIYSSQCANKEIFLKCLYDVKENLLVYLQKESEKINRYRLSTYSAFANIWQFLEPEPQSRFAEFRSRFSANETIDVMTFNYTSTLEKLFGFNNSPVKISSSADLRNILHVHGTLDSMMVMGVNDTSQIANTAFNTDLDVVEDFVKPEYNDACMNNKNTVCESLIQNANMIVLYGTSLGLSDEKWWKLIGKRMIKDNYPLLIYLPYDEKKNLLTEPNHLRRWTMESVREIQGKFDINLDEKLLSYRICVAFNKRLFPIVKSEQLLNKVK